MPDRPTDSDQFNLVDVGDTGRGKWARVLRKGGTRSGARRRSAQAMLTLGRFWTDAMPGADKTWWEDRAAEEKFRVRSDSLKDVTGFSLFLMSNMAALVAGDELLGIAPATADTEIELLAIVAVAEDSNSGMIFDAFLGAFPPTWFMENFISVIKPVNMTDTDRLRSTEIIGKVIPNEEWVFPMGPTIPQYLPLPFDVVSGDQVGFHVQKRYGGQAGTEAFRGEADEDSIVEVTVT